MSDASGASRKKSIVTWLIVVTALVLLGVVLWRLDRAPTTDDAYVYADTINVVPEVNGKIVEMPVRDNQPVKRGDLLFRIDPRPYQDALDQARARRVTLDRQIALTQRSEVDAQIALAELNLEFTEVRAPFDGRVAALRTTVGQFASALKPVFTLIDTRHWYVIANFRETDLKDVRAGMPATVYLMSDTGRRFDGTIDSISYGVLPDDGGVVLEGLPRVARSINWVHVSQRFPVKIAVRNPDPETFRIGTSAVATLRPGAAVHDAAR